jgi:hypothetical protein
MTREDVYKLIDGERIYLDSLTLACEEASSDPMSLLVGHQYSIAEEAMMIQYFSSLIPAIFYKTAGYDETLALIRQVAALCVRCMETHGAPARQNKTIED